MNLECIKEIRTGADARQYRTQFKIADNCEPEWITLIYMTDGKYKQLHIVAPSSAVFRMWVDTVRKLWELRQELMSTGIGGRVQGLAGVRRRENAWEKLYWKSADESGEERLDWKEVKKLCLRLNINMPQEKLRSIFKVRDIIIPCDCLLITCPSSKPISITAITSISRISVDSSNF